MSGDFLDTNVIVYTFDTVDLRKQGIATSVVDSARREGTGRISFQVVQEALNIVLNRLDPPLSESEAQELLDGVLFPLWDIMPSQPLYIRALGIRARFRFTFYDSLIIAAALEAGCDRLLTEDLQHGQVIEGLRIENPFL